MFSGSAGATLRRGCAGAARAAREEGGSRPRRSSVAVASAAAADSASSASAAPTGASFVRAHLRDLAAYTPILPFDVLSASLGRDPADIIKCDANENPYGPPPEVKEALANLDFPHIYPDPESRRLRAMLSEDTGCPMENLLVGCGADELIDLLMRCVLDPGDYIVNTPPTFGMYAFDAEVNGAQVVDCPRGTEDFALDVDAIEAAVAEYSPKIVFLTSPNNPDGSVISEEDLERVLALPVLVVLDEAYIEFGRAASHITDVPQRENLVVLRTFSKRAALAGLRVGYGAFPASLIEFLWRAKQPYNVSVAAEVAACAALSNPEYLSTVKEALVTERERLFELLDSEVDYLEPSPSAANFILCRVHGRDAGELRTRLAEEHGIMVRHYTKPAALNGCVRISVGKPEHTDAMITALKIM
mmetsp:Transcript_31565/g.102867  ORF Transcript_31565/g.102867 Transcript_31565/m.102867 type:complete len:417 (-) Transcript_31565:637-1887(-)|eukprot:CAMPEP_0170142396 /NCGR_PEP_ID=MMETSP0033_2-20121228/7603_1 /TAXON_ID=195969 /ORGANISM="Dolichomastix tenuilepis, Strain CCMP3274" /LENGTH=416 /DNA_ID=CAMNT_0010378721 /DNA_START=129 /DNA_END=1379 /DNA_ORIENTATION=+